ncbi:MAG: histidine triad nucleotide-binding protein [Rhodocyclaceae bacterium]
MSDCIFCRIVAGQIPATKVFEDEDVVAFRDIHPQAALHVLIIPKKHIATLFDVVPDEDQAVLGKMLALAPRIAAKNGSSDGFRTIINTGRLGGQEVYHLHIHVVGGQAMPAMLKY